MLGNNKAAQDVCNNAYLKNKRANNYFCNWAIALLNLKTHSEAVDVIKRAIDVNKKNASIFSLMIEIELWIVWAEIMKSKGEFKTAKDKLERALELDPKNAYAEAELEKVKELLRADSTGELEEAIMEISSKKIEGSNPSVRNCECSIF